MSQFFTKISDSPLSFRIQKLKDFCGLLQTHESKILSALDVDLKKPELEAVSSEILPVRHELKFVLKHLRSWTKPRRVRSRFWTLTHFGAGAVIKPESVGRVLIIGPWNYPFHLCILPMIGAFAAGNRVTLKPSEFAPATSRAIADLIKDWNVGEWVTVKEGDVRVSQELTKEPWGKIFFTGGTEIGRLVMAEAAKTLSPVTLELGGKSPALIDSDVDLETAVRRLLWGKIYNSGQTCVAPDYVLVPQSLESKFIEVSKKIQKSFFPKGALQSSDYGKIISKRHFDRLKSFLTEGDILSGGGFDENAQKIEPTMLRVTNKQSKILTEEIFGPLLPIVTYSNVSEAIDLISSQPPPLAFYVFSNSRSFQNLAVNQIRAGGICINDTIIHLSHSRLPFGGFRESGIGAYHGEESFKCFSHFKAVERKSLKLDLPLRYPPYKIRLGKFLRKFV